MGKLTNSFWIFKDEIRMKSLSEEPEEFLYFYDVVDNKKMNYLISKFIIKAFLHYFVYENTTEREMRSLLKSKVPEKKKFKKYQDEFLQFPMSMLGIADEFTLELLNTIDIQKNPLHTINNEISYRFKLDWEKYSPYTLKRYRHLKSSKTHREKPSESEKELLTRMRLH